MTAIRFERYGSTDVLELQDVEIPHVGGDGVLVQVHAAAGPRRTTAPALVRSV